MHHQIDNRNDEAIQEGRGKQSSQNNFRHRALYLIAGKVTAECQRDQCQCAGQGCHQNRIQAIQRTAYHTVVHSVAFFLLQVVVMADQQHAVSGGDAEQGDETDDGRNADFPCGDEQGKHAANQCQRQVDKDDCTFLDTAELVIQQQEYHNDRHE